MQPIYLVVGVPASGKSWICEQLRDYCTYVHHDAYIGHANQPHAYVREILAAAETSDKPLLIEAPFSVNAIKEPLEAAGHGVTPVFIIEDHEVLEARYQRREGKAIPKGHLTRTETYRQRALEWKSFQGTSQEVLDHLKASLGATGIVDTSGVARGRRQYGSADRGD